MFSSLPFRYYTSGDAGMIDDDGYVHVMARPDDVINTAGHRLSTGAMEEVLMDHADVAECAVIGVNDDMKGEVPIGLVTVTAGSTTSERDLSAQLVALIRVIYNMAHPVHIEHAFPVITTIYF